jgi:hypothetical protein
MPVMLGDLNGQRSRALPWCVSTGGGSEQSDRFIRPGNGRLETDQLAIAPAKTEGAISDRANGAEYGQRCADGRSRPTERSWPVRRAGSDGLARG